MADLTPSERGALRHARAQLDQFERTPEPRYAESAVRATAALLTAACEGDRGRRADAEAAASAALDEAPIDDLAVAALAQDRPLAVGDRVEDHESDRGTVVRIEDGYVYVDGDAAGAGDPWRYRPHELGRVYDEAPEEDDESEARDRAAALNYLRHEPCYRVELNRRYGPTPRVSFVEATSEEDATALLRVGNDWERTHLVQPSPPLRVVSVRRATVADVDEFLAES